MSAEQYMPDLPLLLIDDNPLNLRLAGFLLRSAGFEVRNAVSAEHALELLAREQFSLLLVDIQLPGMDGLEFTRLVRNTPAWASLPVVALTAYSMRGDDERMLAAGCDGYISKPINTRTFADQVQKHLKLENSAPEALPSPEIAQLKEEFLLRVVAGARALLAQTDIELGGPDTFVTLHRWAGFAGSVGLGSLTDLAREAEQHFKQPPSVCGPLVRPALTSILGLLESAREN